MRSLDVILKIFLFLDKTRKMFTLSLSPVFLLGILHVRMWCLDCGSHLATVGEKPEDGSQNNKDGGTKEWGNVCELGCGAQMEGSRKLLTA